MFDELKRRVLDRWRNHLQEVKYADWFEKVYLSCGFRYWYYSAAGRNGVLPNNNPVESYHDVCHDTTNMKKGVCFKMGPVRYHTSSAVYF